MKKMMPDIHQKADDAYFRAYSDIAGHLNRAERRTDKGKLIDAKAKIAALEAENKVLRKSRED